MKNIQAIFITILTFLITSGVCAQEKLKISGRVLSELDRPMADAVVTVPGAESVTTGDDGTFHLEISRTADKINIWAPGYYEVSQMINGRSEITIVMVPKSSYKYNETRVLPFRIDQTGDDITSAVNITKEDFTDGSMYIDRALSGQVAGLRLTRNGGMPGDGSYMNLRGIRSFIGTNAPLVVINGIPYLADNGESQLLNGLTRNFFQAYNISDIQNITVLKGAEASMYGSMGSNGVILIETDGAPSDDLETKISFYGQYGVNWNNKRIPLLNNSDYKSYLSDIGMTYFSNMESFFSEFPFLSNPDNKYNYLYNNRTDWQDEIYRRSFVTDNLFRIEGGDAVAKYDLSLGYLQDNGILDNTKSQRYHTQLNTNVFISKKVELFTTIGLAYSTGEYQEQGMTKQTNPVLAAYKHAPILSPYAKDGDGNLLSSYASYYYGISKNMDFANSNPLAILHTLDGRDRQYDINMRVGLNYTITPEISVTGTVGLYYNYKNEHLFVPGLTDHTIIPFFDQYGEAQNTVKEGVGETLNWYYNINGRFRKTFNGVHKLNALAGMQAIMSKNEYDAGVGRNTANDFYQTLGSSAAIGRSFYGYLEKWNWMNFYAHADYTYNDMFAASVNLAVDGASSSGTYGQLFRAYPSAGLTWLGKGWLPLSNSTFVNRFNIRAEYGLTGNSRFSSNYGKYYYTSKPYQDIAGIVRANVSNTKLKPEKNAQLNLGADISLLNNRLDISFDYYNIQSSDVIFAVPLSAVYGSTTYFDNLGKLENKGMELGIMASLVRTRDFEWIVGGNIAQNKNKVKSLSNGVDQIVTAFADGSQVVTRVGENPYQFYGYEVAGVFSTQAQANAANLKNASGRSYEAGDVHYVDKNGDHRIDYKDRVALGSATPKYFGGFFTHVRYRSFGLSAEFAYSKGNKAYNAVRRELESLSDFGNQSASAAGRWNVEGQKTNTPRAQWADPIGNSDFSARWIEDASYLRMKNITLSYDFDRKLFNFIRSGTIYITAENLWTETKYLGLDPEFAYSNEDIMQGFDYSKLMQPKSIKFGINLNF